MSLQQELAAFYARSGFGEIVGRRPRTVPVYTGCLLVPLPNIETRRRYLQYHDLHHLITGYSVGRIGEGEVSAWELGAGSAFVSPTLGLMNLIGLSTGLVLKPRRMWQAFGRGCASRTLYPRSVRALVDAGHWQDVAALRRDFLGTRTWRLPATLRAAEFACYSAAAMLVHATIALPAVLVRITSDMLLGRSFIQAVKPVRRADLF